MFADLTGTRAVIDVRVFEGISGIHSIADEWTRLADEQEKPTLLQYPDYYQSYVETLGAGQESFKLVAIYLDAKIVGLLPCCFKMRSVMGRQLRFLEFPETPNPRHDILFSPDISHSDLIAILQKKLRSPFEWDVMRLAGVPEESRLVANGNNSRQAYSLYRQTELNNYLDVTEGDYLKTHVSSKFRYNLRRAAKRLADLGECTYVTVDSFPLLEQAYQDFLDLEASGWKSQRGGRRAIKLHAEQVAFYADLMRRFAVAGDCHIHLLRLGDTPIAASFAVRKRDTVYSLKSGYDESFAKIVPGNLLRQYEIGRYSADASVRYFDLISAYEWQKQWRPRARKVFDVYLFNKTFGGMLYYALRRTKMALKARSR